MSRIVTVTLNPAVDLGCTADHVRPTHKIRTFDEHIDPGGGGINVARVLHALGAETMAVIVAGGVTGALIEELLTECGVPHQTVHCHGRSRISYTVFDRANKEEYRFVPLGPVASPHDWTDVLAILEEVECAWIVASGSLEPGMPADLYGTIARLARPRGIRIAVDTSGAALRAALDAGVDFVEPSLNELEAYARRALSDPGDQEAEALAMVRGGSAGMVAITLGDEGAIFASAEGVLRVPAIPVPFRGAVGAGDSFVAGMIWALTRGLPAAEALGWATAAGSATVSRAGTARVRLEDVE